MKVWIGFLFATVLLASRPHIDRGERAQPRGLVLAGCCGVTTAALFFYRFI